MDGEVPTSLAQRAQAIAADQSLPLGTTDSYPLPGVTTLIRGEPRVWGRDAQGPLVEGCFRVGAVFLPGEAPAAAAIVSSATATEKIVGVLTAVSLAVGTFATIITIRRRRR